LVEDLLQAVLCLHEHQEKITVTDGFPTVQPPSDLVEVVSRTGHSPHQRRINRYMLSALRYLLRAGLVSNNRANTIHQNL